MERLKNVGEEIYFQLRISDDLFDQVDSQVSLPIMREVIWINVDQSMEAFVRHIYNLLQ
jgi:hypothetical protein